MSIAPIATLLTPATKRRIGRLKRRAEFLHVGKGPRWHGAAMTIQTAVRTDDGGSRFGFTLTKKVGNAVVRNRARRRLREAVRLAADDLPLAVKHDYVIVGRLDAIRLPFEALQRELVRGVASVHQSGTTRSGTGRGRRNRESDGKTPAERTAPERIRPRP